MDKAILFGVFDFVNFHVCKTLLEKGLEVKGIHVVDIDMIDYLDEKKFEVGRNANFYEQSLREWDGKLDSGATIVFSLYDLFMNFKEDILQRETLKKPILEFLKNNHEKNIVVAFLLPAQMAVKNCDKTVFKALNDFVKQSLDISNKLQLIYLPAIYGPWQPKTFLFHQAISTKMNQFQPLNEIREGTLDALFVVDAVRTLIEIFENGLPGRYLIESGKKNHWQRCAAYLKIDKNPGPKNKREMIFDDEEIKRVSIKNVSPIATSLETQIEHMQRLLDLEV